MPFRRVGRWDGAGRVIVGGASTDEVMEEREDWHATEAVIHEAGRGDPFAAAIRGTRMPMIITDPRQPDNPIVFANEAFQHLTGYGRDEVMGRNCRFMQGPATDRSAVAELRRALETREPINVQLLNYRKDGSTFWNALYVSPVRGDDGSLKFFFASQLDVTERVEAQRLIVSQKELVEEEVRVRTAALQAALEAKTTLLHEVDHRVKNNLTMIGSLLRLQSRTLGDPRLSAALENMLSRVDALAAVHRRLYQNEVITRFDLTAFARDLVDDVVGSAGRSDIEIRTDVDPVSIPAHQASALGLILNELVANAVRHAFAGGRGGTLGLSIHERDGEIRIGLSDDGPGFDPDRPTEGAMGHMLVQRLSRQLAATVAWDAPGSGTRVAIVFPSSGSGAET